MVQNYKILIVETDPDIVNIIKDTIKELEFKFSSVESIEAAFKTLSETIFDAIILDLSLPDSKGIEPLETLSNKFPDLAIIIFTGIDDKSVIMDAISSGAQDYIVKGNLNKDVLAHSLRYSIERKKIDSKLKESESKWRSLTENSAEYVVQTDLDGIIIFANRDTLNIPREQAVGQSIFRYISNKSKQELLNLLEKIKNTKKIERSDVYYLEYMAGNQIFIFETRVSPLIKSDMVTGFIITSLDVTDRKHIEEKLKDSEERYRTIVENSNDMIWMLDENYKCIFFNNMVEKLSGHTKDELIKIMNNKNFLQLIEDKDKDKLIDIFKDVVNRKSKQFDFSFYNKSGRKITISANSVPIYSNGTIIISIFGRDITDVIEAEDKFRLAREQLDKSNKEIEKFVYIASHELKEPLRSISSFTELLADRYKDKLDTDANEFINIIMNGTARMKDMIDDLLKLSRIESRGNEFANTDISEVLKSVKLNLHDLIARNGARIIIDEMPIVYCDKIQITQVFQNLIENAIKFSKKDIISQIHISATNTNNEWSFSIKDNGIGINKKNFNKLFIMFQRLHNRDEYPGTGIGLAICKKIIDRHDGKIWLESEIDKGSTFSFSIPSKS